MKSPQPSEALPPPKQSRWSSFLFLSLPFGYCLTHSSRGKEGSKQQPNQELLNAASSAPNSVPWKERPNDSVPSGQTNPPRSLPEAPCQSRFPPRREGRRKRAAPSWNVWQPALKEKLVQAPGPGAEGSAGPSAPPTSAASGYRKAKPHYYQTFPPQDDFLPS